MGTLTRTEIDRLKKVESAKMRRALLQSWTGIKNDIVLTNLIDRIDLGDIDGAIQVANIIAADFAGVAAVITSSYSVAGERVGDVIGKVQKGDFAVAFGFDVRAPRAEDWLRARSSGLITEIIDDQREMIRTSLTRSMEAGIGPRESALDLVGRVDRLTGRRTGGLIGLTTQQAGYVDNMTADLTNLDNNYFTRTRRDKRFDSVVRRAIENGKPLTKAQITKITGRYADRLLQLRGEMISRTETITAMRAGQQEAILQAMEDEGISTTDATKSWSITGDGNTRDAHVYMSGQTVNIDQPFIAPNGSRLMYPGDSSLGASADLVIGCRCSSRTQVNFVGRELSLMGF